MFINVLVIAFVLVPKAEIDLRLAEAAKNGDVAAVRVLIDQKADVNAPGPDGTPPLFWAVQSEDLATAQLLIRAGAEVKSANRYGITPIQIAATSGNVAMIRTLLDGVLVTEAGLVFGAGRVLKPKKKRKHMKKQFGKLPESQGDRIEVEPCV